MKLVPILCGGFHELLDDGRTPREDAESRVDRGLREAERWHGGATVYVAARGPLARRPALRRPGGELDDRTQQEVEAKDRAALDAARAGDADGWFHAIAAHGDSTRICGFAPTYALLRRRRRIVEHLFQDGEWVVLEWRDPGGLRGCGFFHVENGKISFQRGYWDKLSFLRQHGLPFPTE